MKTATEQVNVLFGKRWFTRVLKNNGQPFAVLAVGKSKARGRKPRDIYYMGISVCGERDNFCYKKGTNLAIGRLCAAKLNKKNTLMVRECEKAPEVLDRMQGLLGFDGRMHKSAYDVTEWFIQQQGLEIED